MNNLIKGKLIQLKTYEKALITELQLENRIKGFHSKNNLNQFKKDLKLVRKQINELNNILNKSSQTDQEDTKGGISSLSSILNNNERE